MFGQLLGRIFSRGTARTVGRTTVRVGVPVTAGAVGANYLSNNRLNNSPDLNPDHPANEANQPLTTPDGTILLNSGQVAQSDSNTQSGLAAFFNEDSLIVGGIGALIGYFVGNSAVGALIGGGVGALIGKPLVEAIAGMAGVSPAQQGNTQTPIQGQQQTTSVAQNPVNTVLNTVQLQGLGNAPGVTGGNTVTSSPVQVIPLQTTVNNGPTTNR